MAIMDMGAILSAIDEKGTGIPPADPLSFQVIAGDNKATINWNLKEKIEVESNTLSRTGGIKVLRKKTGFPENPTDGEVVVESTSLSGSFVDTSVVNDSEYFYRGFAVSDHGVYNLTDSCKKSVIPTDQEICSVTVSTKDALATLGGEYISCVTLHDITDDSSQEKRVMNGGIGNVQFEAPVGHSYELMLKIQKAHYSIVDQQLVITYEDCASAIIGNMVYYADANASGPYTAERANTREIALEFKDVKIVTWSAGTGEEIVAMVEAARAGMIDLYDYWTVGNEKVVHLSAMTTTHEGATVVGESQPEQDITIVLMTKGGIPLAGGGECIFAWGCKEALATKGYMNPSNTNSGSWESCKRRTWCNNNFFNALPEWLQEITTPMLTKTPITETGSDWQTCEDLIALPSCAQVFESASSYMNANEFRGDLICFDYYKNSANRIKKQGISGGTVDYWWERSPSDYSSYRGQCFCFVYSSGAPGSNGASDAYGVSPFGCV